MQIRYLLWPKHERKPHLGNPNGLERKLPLVCLIEPSGVIKEEVRMVPLLQRNIVRNIVAKENKFRGRNGIDRVTKEYISAGGPTKQNDLNFSFKSI